jgi:CelD/BcsL family acetyltransferase involved in cellulose biosynthesis
MNSLISIPAGDHYCKGYLVKVDTEEIDESGLEKISPAWTELCKRCSLTTPFQFPHWIIPWWNNLGGGSLKTVVFTDGYALAGVAPFFIFKNESGKRILCFIGTGITDYLDIIVLPGYEKVVFNSVMQYLNDISSEWDECDLQDIPENSILLHCEYPDIFAVKRSDYNICSHLELPSNLESLRTSLPKKLRKNLSRAARMLSRNGGYHLEVADENTVESFLQRLFGLHQARWSSKNQKGVLHNDSLKKFHTQAASGLVRHGLLRIYEMKFCQKAIAAYYTLAHNNRVYAYLGGFDPLMEQYSPGTLLLYHAIEDSVKRGAARFDFLRGDEKYKKYWRPVYSINSRIQIRKREK